MIRPIPKFLSPNSNTHSISLSNFKSLFQVSKIKNPHFTSLSNFKTLFISLSKIEIPFESISEVEEMSRNRLKVAEMEKTNLQNSIHSVLVELKNIEKHLGSTHISFEQCFHELEAREKHLVSTEQSLSKATQQFELIRQSIEMKEKEFHGVQEKFAAEQKLLRESFSGNIEMGQSVYEAIQKWVGEKLEEIKVKEELLKVRGKELDYKEERLREKEKGMGMEFTKKLEVIQKRLDFANEFIQQTGKKLESDLVELELKGKELLGTPYLLIGGDGTRARLEVPTHADQLANTGCSNASVFFVN